MTEEEKKGLQMVPKAVKPGMFKEHLNGMQRGGAEIVPDDELPGQKRPNADPTESFKP